LSTAASNYNKILNRLFLILVFVFFQIHTVSAQTGPGGVGSSTDNLYWLRADSITGISDGNPITTWEDVSGNNNDVTQSTAGNRPTFGTNTLNGFPVVRFDDANQEFLYDTFPGYLNPPFTILAVCRFDNTTAYAINIGNHGNNHNTSIIRDDSRNAYLCNVGGSPKRWEGPQDSLPSGVVKILNALHSSSTTHSLYQNGFSQSLTAYSSPDISDLDSILNIGRSLDGTTGGDYLDGFIAELSVYT